MKLSDWAKKQGISYLTAYRWFKDGKLPVQAYQSDSGTIIVQDDSEHLEQPMAGNTSQSNDVMSLFLKKTVEFSKNESTIEDFAAFIISNFSLKLNGSSESSPKYSKNKPKTEDIQKHFQKFIPEKNSIDHLKMIKSLIKDNPNGPAVEYPINNSDDLSEIFSDSNLGHSFSKAPTALDYDLGAAVEGVAARNVEFVSTPQQTNYTGSTVATSFDNFSTSVSLNSAEPSYLNKIRSDVDALPVVNTVDYRGFTPPVAAAMPKRRGRKPSKKSGSNQ